MSYQGANIATGSFVGCGTNVNNKMMKVTEDCFISWATEAGGFTRAQLILLGLEWPPVHGWKKSLIGTEITNELYQKVLAAKHTLAKVKKTKSANILSNFGKDFMKHFEFRIELEYFESAGFVRRCTNVERELPSASRATKLNSNVCHKAVTTPRPQLRASHAAKSARIRC